MYRQYPASLAVSISSCALALFLWVFPDQAWAESVHLAWDPSVGGNTTGYFIYRATSSGGPYTRLSLSPWPLTYYTDDTAEAGQSFFYTVTAVNINGWESAFSKEATATLSAFDPSPAAAAFGVRVTSDPTVSSGELVVLTGSAWNPENRNLTFSWVQTSQSTVQIVGLDKLEASFFAPVVTKDVTLTFMFAARDISGSYAYDTVNVIVLPR